MSDRGQQTPPPAAPVADPSAPGPDPDTDHAPSGPDPDTDHSAPGHTTPEPDPDTDYTGAGLDPDTDRTGNDLDPDTDHTDAELDPDSEHAAHGPGQAAAPAAAFEAAEPIELQDAPFSLLGGEESGQDGPAPLGKRRRRTRTIVLSSLLAVGLAGAGAIGWFYWQIHSEQDAVLTLPPRIGDLALDTSDNAQDAASYLQNALAAEVDVDTSVGAVYSADEGKNVLFVGGTTLFWSPEKDLETSFTTLIADEQGAVTGLHDVDAGSLGGTMKCGVTKTESGNLPVCGWADHGSLALAMFPDLPESEAATLMRQMREAIQTRN